MPNTVQLHRVLRATPEKVYRALSFTNYTERFDDPHLPGGGQATISLKPVSCGTELNIVQEGLPDAIPPEACYLGWQESLAQLASLVEPEIPEP